MLSFFNFQLIYIADLTRNPVWTKFHSYTIIATSRLGNGDRERTKEPQPAQRLLSINQKSDS